MTTFLLVHGHCHGGWCWERVSPFLAAMGHTVRCPTLRGMGDRIHESGPSVGLEVHIAELSADISASLEAQVVLVGHSYGGMVIAGAAARQPDRVSKLIYLDAVAPLDGQSLFDCLPHLRELFRAGAVDGWRLDPPDPSVWGVTEQADLDWIAGRLTPVSLATCEEPVRIADGALDGIPKVFVRCSESTLAVCVQAAVASRSGWVTREIQAGHDAMITQPQELAVLLNDLSR